MTPPGCPAWSAFGKNAGCAELRQKIIKQCRLPAEQFDFALTSAGASVAHKGVRQLQSLPKGLALACICALVCDDERSKKNDVGQFANS